MSRSNSYSAEGTLAATTATITFPWPVREVQVTNDSASNNLQYRLNTTETYRTLKPNETSRLEDVRIKELYINSSASVAYRVWGLG